MMSMTRLLLVVSAASDVPTITFDEGFAPLFGEANMERSPTRILYRPAGRTTLDGRYRTSHICAEIRLPFGRLTNVDQITRSICQRGQCAFTQRSTQH